MVTGEMYKSNKPREVRHENQRSGAQGPKPSAGKLLAVYKVWASAKQGD